MCIPLAAAALIATAASASVSAIGASKEGQANANALNYQAGVAQQNAKAAAATGEVDATESEMRTKQLASQQRAGFAASGIDPNSGSATDVLAGTAMAGSLDALTIRSNAARTAFGQTAQASLDTSGASNAIKAGQIGAISSIVGGASSVSDKWLSYKNPGLVGGSGLSDSSDLE